MDLKKDDAEKQNEQKKEEQDNEGNKLKEQE